MNKVREQVLLSISKRKKDIDINKGNWYRKDGSRWMNDRGFVEPYRQIGRIPSHNPDNPEFPEKVGGRTKSESDLSDSERLKLLLEMEPVDVSEPVDFGNLDRKEINAKVKILFFNLKDKGAVLPDGRRVAFSTKGFHKILSHSADTLGLQIIEDIPRLIYKSIFLYREPNIKNKFNIEFFENRGVKSRLNGKEYFIRFVLRKMNNVVELYHYDHHLIEGDLIKKVANPLDPHQLTKQGGGEKLPKEKLYQWAIKASKKQDNTMGNDKEITKGFLGFGGNSKPKPLISNVSTPRQGLVKKQIIDSRGRRQAKWVRPNEVQTPIEKKREEAKTQRKKISHLNHSEEDKKKIEEITKRHKEFENKAKEQRRVFGSGPQLPKPGIIMRVYAQGKVNVGGMLAEVQRIAEDGKSVFAMLTSGKTYEFPLEQLHFAKSLLYETLEKEKESRNT